MTRYLAIFITATAMAMAAVAAWDRGGNAVDRALLVSLSVAIVAAVHLLPALSRLPVTWLVWAGCLLCAIYGHLTFLTHAGLRAGESRAQHTALLEGTRQQLDAVQGAIAEIKARPVTTVSAELAATQGSRRRSALRMELAEASRSAALRDEYIRLAGTATIAQVTGEKDPVTARLAEVTGSSEAGVSIVIGVTFSVLLELVGCLLWIEALRTGKTQAPPQYSGLPEIAGNDAVATLREAVASGLCKPTVAGIRTYLGCSQAKAMEMRRTLQAS